MIILPGDVLLEIFKFYVDQVDRADAWHALVHVCREWRNVVFASPRWLHMKLLCTNRNPAKKMLDIWPALPIVIDAIIMNSRQSGVTNVIAALKQHHRVCGINIRNVSHSLLTSTVMEKQFPELADLTLHSNGKNLPVVPDLFLGGSAPRLQSLEFRGIPFPFPALGKLLLSATNLVTLRLLDIPNSAIISSELIVTSLSALTMLKEFFIGFRSPRPRAGQEHLPLLKRLALPCLTEFYFKGNSECLEDILGRIDTPALDRASITFFNQLIFDTPLLRDFLSRTKLFQEVHLADVTPAGSYIKFTLSRRKGMADCSILDVRISCSVAEWQLSSLAQICSASLPPLPTLDRLNIHEEMFMPSRSRLEWPNDMETSQWLELLRPFVTVRKLDILATFSCADQVALALREFTGYTVTEVLPALRQVFVACPFPPGPIQEAFAPFSTARHLTGRTVLVDVHPHGGRSMS